MKNDYITQMREGKDFQTRSLLALILRLSMPTILAQISIIVMEYADAAMVGRLGANATAAIGMVATTTWLYGGLSNSAVIGFNVLVSQRIGAGDHEGARRIMKQGLLLSFLLSLVLMLTGVAIHAYLPVWLGGAPEVVGDASRYFLIFSLSLPFMMLNFIAAGMLESSGNMRTPGLLESLMCVLNIGYNWLFIYVAGWGVTGAAVGTALSEITIAFPMAYALLVRSPVLHLRKGEPFRLVKKEIRQAVKIALPICLEQTVMSSAYIMTTRIIAPLGAVSVAAHSLAVTAEGICYMPGYGIASASTALIGQTIGAQRKDLTRRIGWMTTLFGMTIMGVTGWLMFAAAPQMMGLLTPVEEIRTLGAQVLRIEVWAEPMFAASIVATGVFRGMGDTLVPSLMNLLSMWGVRISLSALLTVRFGLRGAWIAMTIELCFRGVIFLLRLYHKTKKGKNHEVKAG